MPDREVVGRCDFKGYDVIAGGGPVQIITVTWVVPDNERSPHVLECYLDYEPLKKDHPHIERYEAELAKWTQTSGDDREEPAEPIRDHWYLVAEQGVELADITDAVLNADVAVDNAPQEARDELVRRYLEKKYPQTGQD